MKYFFHFIFQANKWSHSLISLFSNYVLYAYYVQDSVLGIGCLQQISNVCMRKSSCPYNAYILVETVYKKSVHGGAWVAQ